jgi:hypothetical protein
MENWTHKYIYKLKHSLNKIATGRVQVSREYSDEEVLALAKKMNNSLGQDAKLLECKLIDQR